MTDHLQPENHIPIVEDVLRNFALDTWGDMDNWSYSLAPPIGPGDAQYAIRPYRWLGTIVKTSADIELTRGNNLVSPNIDPDNNYVVVWDFGRPSVLGGFRIFTLKFYEHTVPNRATYYYLLEVRSWAKPNRNELRDKLLQLYAFLQANPILLTEYRPADGYEKSFGQGIELMMRLIMHYR